MPIWALCTEWSHGTKTPCKRANNTVGPWKERIFLTDVIYLFFLPNSTACHPSRGIVVPSDRFFQGFIRIHTKKTNMSHLLPNFQGRIQHFFQEGGHSSLALLQHQLKFQFSFFFFAEYQLDQKTAGHLGGGGGAHPQYPPPRSTPNFSKCHYHAFKS